MVRPKVPIAKWRSHSSQLRSASSMKYFSTRGGPEELSFEDTVLTGLAPNGGLYIPSAIPSLPKNWRSDWKDYSWVDLSTAILSLYISADEISESELRNLVAKSYKLFREPEIAPLKKLNDQKYILELWHGPTWAFKDVALQFLGNLFEFFLVRRNALKAQKGETNFEKLTVVGATSGDTGSAAIYGLRGKENVEIYILHPKGRVSPIQEAQMTTILDENVHNLAVEGTFDDCQDIVKALFSDTKFNQKHHLGAVNSINWARILAQIVYYFSAYFQLRKQLNLSENEDIPIQFVVPTGNFGDILAGFYATKMGLPVDNKLGIATNSNDILARFWKTGNYEKVDSSMVLLAKPPETSSDERHPTRDSSGVQETLSPAMDILVSSNFERLLWYLALESSGDQGQAGDIVNGWMSKMKENGRVEIPKEALEAARRDFCAERIGDEETLSTIQSYYLDTPSYVADPHTAVGLTAAERMASHNEKGTIQIVLSTAHPAKFSEAVTLALKDSMSFDFDRDVMPIVFKGLLSQPRQVVDVPAADINLVKESIERHNK